MNKKNIILVLILLVIILVYLIFVRNKYILYRRKNTLNYWMNSLKYDRLDEKKLLVDKYESKLYIQENFPEIEIIKALYIYENPKDIRKIKIPEYCVIKATFGGGGDRNIVITPNNKISKKKIEYLTTFWLKKNFGNRIIPYYSEPQYYGKNRILIEEYMKNLNDFKFFMIKGKIAFIHCVVERFNNYTRNFYDKDWNILYFQINRKNTNRTIIKPKNFEKMKEFCYKFIEKTKFEFVRIDLYEINEKIYFGEFTFTPGNCLEKFTNNYDKILYDKYVKNSN